MVRRATTQATITPMQIRPIQTDAEHEAALREIETLWGAEDGTDAGDRLDGLVILVDAYEGQRWPIAPLNPVRAIEAAVAMNGHTRADPAATRWIFWREVTG